MPPIHSFFQSPTAITKLFSRCAISEAHCLCKATLGTVCSAGFWSWWLRVSSTWRLRFSSLMMKCARRAIISSGSTWKKPRDVGPILRLLATGRPSLEWMLHSNRVAIWSIAMQASKGHEADARQSGRESIRESSVAAILLTRITASRAVRSEWICASRYSIISVQAEMQRALVGGRVNSAIEGDEARVGGKEVASGLGLRGLRWRSCCRCKEASDLAGEAGACIEGTFGSVLMKGWSDGILS